MTNSNLCVKIPNGSAQSADPNYSGHTEPPLLASAADGPARSYTFTKRKEAFGKVTVTFQSRPEAAGAMTMLRDGSNDPNPNPRVK